MGSLRFASSPLGAKSTGDYRARRLGPGMPWIQECRGYKGFPACPANVLPSRRILRMCQGSNMVRRANPAVQGFDCRAKKSLGKSPTVLLPDYPMDYARRPEGMTTRLTAGSAALSGCGAWAARKMLKE
jgi:hypothetical protein